ncbi:hypothetical protein A4A49_00180 [Nicotiana attenuata]|uniref:Uncharacterized protein n=1 Tax=Nicotiana attenuata TaxID=49451 RepID=A0A1J6ITK1_NICAT|nr:hypothetical protein A4A49_00180 [Nicotiana attenuata]
MMGKISKLLVLRRVYLFQVSHGDQSIVVSNLEATVPLNVTGDQTGDVVAGDGIGNVTVLVVAIADGQTGKELDGAASVIDDTGVVSDRGSNAVCNDPDDGQKFGESGHQTSKAKEQTIMQNLTQVKEIGAGQVLHSSGKSGVVESGDKEGIGAGAVRETEEQSLKSPGRAQRTSLLLTLFGVLENEPVLVDAGMGEKQVDRDATSNTKHPKIPGSATEQPKSKSSGARAVSSRELIHVSEKKAVALHVDNATTGATNI